MTFLFFHLGPKFLLRGFIFFHSFCVSCLNHVFVSSMRAVKCREGAMAWPRMFNSLVACSMFKTVGKTMLSGFPKILGKQNKKQHEKLLVLAA